MGDMSIYEIMMLVCFGAAWPFSIYKSWKYKKSEGKSPLFLSILIAGYVFGILHKIFYSPDFVIYLYMLNIVMVSTDLLLYFKNKKLQK